MIRNSDFKSEIDGVNLTIEHPDGTIEHTALESSDKLTNFPIEVEVINSWYDYETGYRYKGKITDKKLQKEFEKFGITGFKPDDYKKYENKTLYEDALKASQNYDPSIVYFSEFDVIKVLERTPESERGIEL